MCRFTVTVSLMLVAFPHFLVPVLFFDIFQSIVVVVGCYCSVDFLLSENINKYILSTGDRDAKSIISQREALSLMGPKRVDGFVYFDGCAMGPWGLTLGGAPKTDAPPLRRDRRARAPPCTKFYVSS